MNDQKLIQTILILAANPKESSRLRLDEEIREIESGLERSQNRERFLLKQKWAVRPRDIQRAMLDTSPQIVHFSGHGAGDEGLVFEDNLGQVKLVSELALANLFCLFADRVNCVVLNACYSLVQAEAIAQHIPYVIGMNQAIGDRSALEFAVSFYDALATGRSIEFAYELGCNALQLESLEDHLVPVLLKQTKKSGVTNGSVETKSPKLPSYSPCIIAGTPISHPRDFFGRERELKRLFSLLKNRPLQNAAIIGQRRSGKTSLLNYLRTITTTPQDQLRNGQKSDWLPHPEQYRWIFVDFQDSRMAKREKLLQYLSESMQLPIAESYDLDRFMEQVSRHLNSPTVILMDEVGVGLQRCPELDDGFWESLRSLTNMTGGNLAFVLATPESPMDLAHNTGHSSPFFNIFGYTAILGSLKESEASEFIAALEIPIPQDAINWIISQSKGYPLLLQIICREYWFSLEEGNESEDWQQESLRQIKPFEYLLKKL